MGFETGLDLDALTRLSLGLPGLIGHDIHGQVAKAGPPSRLYPIPDFAA
jgi:hydroxymethylglutaryl-CoA lyase